MFIQPEVQKLLALFQKKNLPAIDTQSVEELRRASLNTGPTFGGPTLPMATVEDLAAVGPAGSIPLRLYRPEGVCKTNAPALIYIHGGGWVIGNIETHDRVCRQIATRAECTVISVEYRLAPEHKAPAAAEDCCAALHWIYQHAATLGINPQRLAVGGDSAGGNLSAVVALEARNTNIPLRAQVLIYPCTDARIPLHQYPSRLQNAEIPPLTMGALKYFSNHYVGDNEPMSHDWHISPIMADTLEGVAPALLLTGSIDTLHDEGIAYSNRLEAAQVPVMRQTFPGMIHGFIELSGALNTANEAFNIIGFFLRERLHVTSDQTP
ncbi:alpha/beta hydrolase [Neokomagataea anthophila]|uniref:Alpha/beta hydrolase n=1 Tax=Neokomagataea anthophila TaxID=2826925 RepID=A0ABS5E936_9PROT|nr:alpha/beta hydrolase [Neokomagataea anthophila]MBR0560018.1 alpha/beta hydrolase [Neokomagataea anthophila]